MSLNSTLGEVEEILDRRGDDNNIEYLVRWKKSEHEEDASHDENDEEWVSAAMCNCSTAIAKYEKAHGLWKEEYDVKGIVDSIEDPDGRVEYLVKWKGYDVSENSWVKKRDMKNCKEWIAKFNDGHRYRKNMLEVERIKSREGFWDEMEWYTIVKKGEEDDEENGDAADDEGGQLYSIDELYVAVNGRKALIEFHQRFL